MHDHGQTWVAPEKSRFKRRLLNTQNEKHSGPPCAPQLTRGNTKSDFQAQSTWSRCPWGLHPTMDRESASSPGFWVRQNHRGAAPRWKPATLKHSMWFKPCPFLGMVRKHVTRTQEVVKSYVTSKDRGIKLGHGGLNHLVDRFFMLAYW